MNWALALVAVFFYFLIGLVQVIVRAYLTGRRGSDPLDGLFDGFVMMLVWPAVDSIFFMFWLLDKFEGMVEFFRKRGEESVTSNPDAVNGRRVD